MPWRCRADWRRHPVAVTQPVVVSLPDWHLAAAGVVADEIAGSLIKSQPLSSLEPATLAARVIIQAIRSLDAMGGFELLTSRTIAAVLISYIPHRHIVQETFFSHREAGIGTSGTAVAPLGRPPQRKRPQLNAPQRPL